MVAALTREPSADRSSTRRGGCCQATHAAASSARNETVDAALAAVSWTPASRPRGCPRTDTCSRFRGLRALGAVGLGAERLTVVYSAPPTQHWASGWTARGRARSSGERRRPSRLLSRNHRIPRTVGSASASPARGPSGRSSEPVLRRRPVLGGDECNGPRDHRSNRASGCASALQSGLEAVTRAFAAASLAPPSTQQLLPLSETVRVAPRECSICGFSGRRPRRCRCSQTPVPSRHLTRSGRLAPCSVASRPSRV
jgi:hypothetical protein